MIKRPVFAVLALAAASVTAPALAADSNFYGVFSVGRAKLDADSAVVDNHNLNNGFTMSSTIPSTGATGGKAQLGYNVNKNFALEGGFTYLGKSDFTSVTNAGTIGGSKEAYLFNFDLVGKYPIDEKLAMLGRFGGYYWKTKNEMPNSVTLGTSVVNDNGFDFKFGAGMQYDFTPSFGLRGEFERFNGIGKDTSTGDSKVNQITIGAVLKF